MKHSFSSSLKSVEKFIFIFSLFILATAAPGYTQGYYYLQSTGVNMPYDVNKQGTVILSSANGYQNDVISSVRNLPFTWNFYGSPVTQFKASENGYITFDLSASSSTGVNTTLPNASAPNNCIFAFWDEFDINTGVLNYVYEYTYGSSPSRVHVIQWSVHVKGLSNGNYAYFAIRLYENSDFDVVHNYGIKNGSALSGGTTGAQSASGSVGTMVSSSPNVAMSPPGTQPQNMKVFSFIYGVQSQYDMGKVSINMPELVPTGTNVTVAGTLMNCGIQTINSFELKYTIGSGAVQTQNITGVNIPTSGVYNFSHNIPWISVNPGTLHNVKVWASNLNGNNDGNNINDTINASIFVNLGISGSKRVFIEEFSTAPCGYCTDGHVRLDSILNSYPNTIGMTHHSGFTLDSMTIPESITIAGEFTWAAPTACIDRIQWPGEKHVAIDRWYWKSKAVSQLNKLTPLNISLTTNYNASTRLVDINTSVNFVDYAYPGDLRMNVFVIEDSVVGAGPGYDQWNAYNNSSGHPMFGKGHPIVGYAHRDVIRAVPSSTWGTSALIPFNTAPGQNYSKNYSYTVPALYNDKHIKVIAFVSYYDPSGKREVLNVAEQENILTGLKGGNNSPEVSVYIYPNPAANITSINFTLTNKDNVAIDIYDVVGKKIETVIKGTYAAGNHTVFLNTYELAIGIYSVILKTDQGIFTQKLIIQQ